MLDVDGRPDVDAGAQKLLDVEVALGMPAFIRVRMREFVDDQQGRTPRQGGVEVELAELRSLVDDASARQDFQAFQEGLGLDPPVGFDNADHDVEVRETEPPRARQHRVGLADAGRRSQEHLEAAPSLLARGGEQGVWIRTEIGCARHCRRLGVSRVGPMMGLVEHTFN